MQVIQKPFEEIDGRDIEGLIAKGQAELRTLDYKQELPGNSDGERKEFLADVASFATASGGDIVLGVSDKRDDEGKPTGIPNRVIGLISMNLDAEILKLENLCRDGIEPRIPGLRTKAITDVEGGPVLIIRVPRSWVGPHMVRYKGTSRFFSRTSVGKYQLDVSEIQTAFVASDQLPERIRQFRDERLGRIVADDTPVRLMSSGRVVLHILSLATFASGRIVDVTAIGGEKLTPPQGGSWNYRLNFDGLLSSVPTPEGREASYVQLFRTGAIEAVDAEMLDGASGKIVPIQSIEKELIVETRSYLQLLRQLNAGGPWWVMVTMFGVRDFTIGRERSFRDNPLPIDRDMLVLPEVIIEDAEMAVDVALKPAFDAIWQAGGLSGSRFYNEDGRWAGRS